MVTLADASRDETQKSICLTRLIAAAIGASIALKPMVGVLTSLYNALGKTAVPDLLAGSAAQLPPVHLIVMGGMLLALVVVSIRMLEE